MKGTTWDQRTAAREALLELAPANASTDPGYSHHRSQMFLHAVDRGDINMACAYASHCKVLDVQQIRAVLTLIYG